MRFHLPHVHCPHWARVERIKRLHMVAQVSYLATELGGFHMVHHGFTALVIIGMVLLTLAGQEVEGV